MTVVGRCDWTARSVTVARRRDKTARSVRVVGEFPQRGIVVREVLSLPTLL